MSNDEKPSSFFKVLIKDPTDQLRLPPDFSRKYGDVSEMVNLRGHDGRKWKVKVEPLHGGVLGFTRGWKAFAEDAALQRGEFVVFTMLTDSKFAVSIYDTTFCERAIPLIPPPTPTPTTTTTTTTSTPQYHAASSSSKRRNDVVRSKSSSKSDNPLYFEICCLERHHSSRITLPVEFLKASRMREKKMKSVMMEYVATGGCTSVAVVPQKQRNRVDLTTGWSKFREENGIKLGKNYSFRFIPKLNRIHVNRLH